MGMKRLALKKLANKKRMLVIMPVPVEKLFYAKIVKNKLRQDAL